jgi:hypothetical protein
MVEDGRLPPPDMWMGKLPMWSDETIEANERAAAARAVSPNTVPSKISHDPAATRDLA